MAVGLFVFKRLSWSQTIQFSNEHWRMLNVILFQHSTFKVWFSLYPIEAYYICECRTYDYSNIRLARLNLECLIIPTFDMQIWSLLIPFKSIHVLHWRMSNVWLFQHSTFKSWFLLIPYRGILHWRISYVQLFQQSLSENIEYIEEKQNIFMLWDAYF